MDETTTFVSITSAAAAALAAESPTRTTEDAPKPSGAEPEASEEIVPVPVILTSPDFTQIARQSVAATSFPFRSIVRLFVTETVEDSVTSSRSRTVQPFVAAATAWASVS